jgi:stearoyl-CoA desaturase (delta-9 desaturase)
MWKNMSRSNHSWRIVGLQWLHAGLILVFPTVAVAVAIWELLDNAVFPWMPILAITSYGVTMLGITVGYHRLLAHRAFSTPPAVVVALAIAGSMAAQGAPVYWVSNHRRHHRYSDEAGDPHSPHRAGDRELCGWRGFLHAHVGWMFTHELTNSIEFSRDLLQNKVIGAVNRRYWTWVLLGLFIPAAIGAAMTASWRGAIDGFLWGAGVRLFISYHLTSSINSITHLFGYRTYTTEERSRNNLWLGIPTLGEAWHNNHHAFPTSAKFGLKWWEIDIGWTFIRLLEVLGAANGVRQPSSLSAVRAAATIQQPADEQR